MRNKKFLSTLLVLIMICAAAFGMLVTDAGAERTAVTVAWDTDLATTIGSINGASFSGTQYAEITVPSGTTVSAAVKNGVLFGVNTIFDSNGERLPIVIKGEDATATISFDGVKGNVSCSNSYTFQGMNFLVADAKEPVYFFAGSGEVVLDSVVLSADGTGKNAYFYADNAAAAAFSGWSAPEAGELISTSLTFKNTNYTQASYANGGAAITGALGQVGAVGFDASAYEGASAGDAVTAAKTSATLIIEDSKLSGVWLRKTTAISPVAELNFVMNDTSGANTATTLTGITGVGYATVNDSGANKSGPWNLPDFDYNVEINGGTVSGRVMFFRGAMFKGDMNVTVNGGDLKSDVFVAYGDGVSTGCIDGVITADINGGTIKTLYGSNGARSCFEGDPVVELSQVDNITNINGGTITTYQGNRVSGAIITNVKGGKITTYYGSYVTTGGGGDYEIVCNNVDGGEIGTFYGSGVSKHLDSGKPGTAGYRIHQLITNFNGGTVTGTAYGAGMPQYVKNLTSNFNGTKFSGMVYGTYWANYTDKDNPDAGFGGTKVTENLTINVNSTGLWANEKFKPLGYSIDGDMVLNVNSSLPKFSGMLPTDVGTNNASVKSFTMNVTNATGFGGETFFANMHVLGDANFTFTNCKSNSHVVFMTGGQVDGDLNISIDGFQHSASANHRFFIATTAVDAETGYAKVGGDINFSLKGFKNTSSNPSSTVFALAATRASSKISAYNKIAGNVNLTFENNTLPTWAGTNSEIDGTLSVTYKGTNALANDGYTANVGRVSKLVNNIAGTISGNFYGTSGPIGTWQEIPAEEEGAAPTYELSLGHVENNILPGADIKGIFFGTGDQAVLSVTNTMTGGKIASATGNSAALLASPGCYYGNLGNVTEKVVNNIYSGSIGSNFYGSNGDLSCAVYTNVGNNLYAALNPEAEALSAPTIGRGVMAGGRYFYNETVSVDADGDGTPDVDGEGNPVTETVKRYYGDSKLGTTGPVYINIDGAKLAMTMAIFGPVVAPDANGDAVNLTIRNSTCSTHAYFNMNDDEPLNGNVNIVFENFKLTASDRDYFGPANVAGNVSYVTDGFSVNGDVMLTIGDITGNVSFDLKNTNFASAIGICATYASATAYSSEYKGHADSFMDIGGDFIMNAENVVFGADGSGNFRDVDGSNDSSSIKGSIYGKYVDCTFYQEYVYFSNRNSQNTVQEFENCTFGGLLAKGSTVRLGMREAKGTQLVFVHGNTVIGAEGAPAKVYASRQANHVAYVGARPNASNAPISAETTLNVCEGSAFYAAEGDFPEYNATAYLYDLSVAGAGLIAPVPDADLETEGYQLPADLANQLVLKGNVSVDEISPEFYINGAESEGTVSALGGIWVKGKTYVTAVGDAKIDQISGRNIGTANGYARRRGDALVGASLVGNLAVSLDVNERIVLKLWLYRADVEAYLAAGMKNTVGENVFDYWASIDLTSVGDACDYYLGEGSISLADLDDLELSEDGLYFKVEVGTVSANHFGCEIEFPGSTFAVGGFSPENPLTVMSIAKAGVEDPANTGNEKGINLFKAIYNYGASVLDEQMYEMEGFVKDTALAQPQYTVGSEEDIKFTGMNLLMGDAIGIRFAGEIIDYETVVTLTVDGASTDLFRYDVEEGTVDIYVNMEDVNREFTFVVYTDGAPAVTVKASVKGFTEALMGQNDATLAVAQLAQACADLAA